MDELLLNDDFVDEELEYPEDFDSSDVEVSLIQDEEVVYVLSDNEVTKDDFNILIEEVRGLREDVKNKQYNIVSSGLFDSVSNNNEVGGVVSDNIIDKQLKDYSTLESLSLITILIVIAICLTYIIHKSVFRIRR